MGRRAILRASPEARGGCRNQASAQGVCGTVVHDKQVWATNQEASGVLAMDKAGTRLRVVEPGGGSGAEVVTSRSLHATIDDTEWQRL